MTIFDFTLSVDALDVLDDDIVDSLYEAGCSDATLAQVEGLAIVAFHRRGEDFASAVGSAITQIESTVPGSRVVAVERSPASAHSA